MLTVEDGTGLDNADSYGSVAEANSYFAAFPNDAWSDAETPDKEVALREATRDLDLLYGSLYVGEVLTVDQALLWPRDEPAGIPTRLKRATFELAAELLDPTFSPTAVGSDIGAISEESYRVEGVYSKTVKYGSARTVEPRLNRVLLLLSNLMVAPSDSGALAYLYVTRG